jgi:hypothetical protein
MKRQSFCQVSKNKCVLSPESTCGVNQLYAWELTIVDGYVYHYSSPLSEFYLGILNEFFVNMVN